MLVRLKKMEDAVGGWMNRHSTGMMRAALGVVFLWFGVLKFCPGLCDVEALAQKTMETLTMHRLSGVECIVALGVVECGIGLGLLTGRMPRVTVVCLMGHLAGTFLPLVMFPADCWKHFPYAPTLVGQYILKNVVLMAGAVVVGGRAFARVKVVPDVMARHVMATRQAGMGLVGRV